MRPISGGHAHPTRTQLSSGAAYLRVPFPVPKQDGNGSCHVFPISSSAVRSRSHPTTLGQASQGSTFTRYRNDCHSSCPPRRPATQRHCQKAFGPADAHSHQLHRAAAILQSCIYPSNFASADFLCLYHGASTRGRMHVRSLSTVDRPAHAV
jgi:hypothetical protein